MPEGDQTGARPQDREVLVVGEQHLILAGAGHKTGNHAGQSRFKLCVKEKPKTLQMHSCWKPICNGIWRAFELYLKVHD